MKCKAANNVKSVHRKIRSKHIFVMANKIFKEQTVLFAIHKWESHMKRIRECSYNKTSFYITHILSVLVSLRKTINRVGHILLTAICDFSSRFLMCCIFSSTLILKEKKEKKNIRQKKYEIYSQNLKKCVQNGIVSLLMLLRKNVGWLKGVEKGAENIRDIRRKFLLFQYSSVRTHIYII